MEDFYGYQQLNFSFEGRDAILVFPKDEGKTTKWMLKTEYFGAFPKVELALLEKGWHLAYVKNVNRWGLDEDVEAKGRFADYLSAEYGLDKKCVPVGMSCGGMFDIDFAARFPEKVACLYLDAPVVNLLSCAGGMGEAKIPPEMTREMLDALGLTMPELLAYRKHPLDRLAALVEHRIPAVLVYGEADRTVPYAENGAFIVKAYAGTGIDLLCIGKPGCDHHPHGLEDPTPIVDFILAHAE